MNNKVRFGLGFGFVGLLAGTAGAQSFTELLRAGDNVPGASTLVTRIDDVDVNTSGDYLIELDSDGPTTEDAYVIQNNTIIWQEGTSTGFTAPVGYVAGSYVDSMDINDNGDVLLTFPLTLAGSTSSAQWVMVRNGVTVIETGVTPCNAPGLPPGTFYSGLAEVWQNNNGQLLLGANVALGSTGNTSILLRVDVDSLGNIVSETKVAMVGETLPGHPTFIQGFSFSKGRQAINDNGDFIWYVDDDNNPPGSTLVDSYMYINNTVLFNEADPFPVAPGEVFDHFSTAEVDINNSGDWVFSGFDRRTGSDDSWIFKNVGGVNTVLAHEGEPVPASVPGAFFVAGAGFGGIVPMSNNGDVLWYLDWDDTDTTKDTGLLMNERLFMQEGVTLLSGLPVYNVSDGDTEIGMSDDGKLAICEVVLPGSPNFDAVFMVAFDAPVGSAYCDPAVVNSTGNPGVLVALGSDVAADNNLTLQASGIPVGEFGYFLNGTGNGVIMNPGGAAGNLCVSTLIGRYNSISQIFQADANGEGSLLLDLPTTPTAGGPTAITAGQTWYFQCWYRDTPNTTSNFTNGVEITFN